MAFLVQSNQFLLLQLNFATGIVYAIQGTHKFLGVITHNSKGINTSSRDI